MNSYDVFISYAREDKLIAKRLAKAFESQKGWSVWWDVQLRSGEPFPKKIQEILSNTRCVLVLWSPQSVTSDWVIAEATEGWRRGILLPVCIEKCEPPMPFRQTQSTDLNDWNGSIKAIYFQKLIEDLQTVLSRNHEIKPNEMHERATRRRKYRRRLVTVRLTIAIGLAMTLLLLWVLGRTYFEQQETKQFAERLSLQADKIRREVVSRTPDEVNRTWWALLVNDRKRLDQLDLSILLATEAMKRSHTERTEHSLREGLLLLPWAESRLEVNVRELVRALDFNHDSSLLAAVSGREGTLIWEHGTDKAPMRIRHGGSGTNRKHRGPFVVDFSPSNNVVATGGPDQTARLWDARTGEELHRLEHRSEVTAVSFGTKDILASSTKGGAVRVWDTRSGRELVSMHHLNEVNWVGVSPSGRYLASTSADKTSRVWETSTGIPTVILEHDQIPEAACFSPDETKIVTFGENIPTTLWEISSGEDILQIPISSNHNAGAVFGPEGRVMVVGGLNGTL